MSLLPLEVYEPPTNNFYAVLLAGGHGARLWPLSRPNYPKPLLALTESRSLFKITVDRLSGLFTPDHTYVVTSTALRDTLYAQVGGISLKNYLCEPTSRDTAPAVGLSAFTIAQHYPDAVLAILSTDHAMEQTETLSGAFRAAYTVAQQGFIVVIGIRPTHAATEYGYIERGESLYDLNGVTVYQARQFIEKPERERAEQLFNAGNYSWDAGFVIASTQTLIAEFTRQQPAMAQLLQDMVQSPHPDLWNRLPIISFDYAILENALQIAVIPVDMPWHDLGTWNAVYEALPHDEQGNAAFAPLQTPDFINTQRTLVWSERRVVAIGIDDLIIVDTPDTLLICRRDQLGQVRDLSRNETNMPE